MIQKQATVTEKLYELDSELYEFSATVLSCEKREQGDYAVVLDRTAFFPEGGGQYADEGTLDGIDVQDVRIRDGQIIHMLSQPLTVGACVSGGLNVDTRFARMQNHTGEHIISGIVYAQYGYNNVGFHLGNVEMTMDFDGVLTEDQLREVELMANCYVWKNVPVRAEYPAANTLAALNYRSKLDLTENVRIVTVEGVDACACCAPHVKMTGEIGVIKIVNAIHYKGGMRLWVLCGRWALQDYCQKHDDILSVTRKHSVKPHQLVEIATKLNDELIATRVGLSAAMREAMQYRLQLATPDDRGNLLFFVRDTEANIQRELADGGADRCTGICAVFCEGDKGVRYVCVSRHKPLRAIGKQMNEACHGRGGGTDEMLQGTLACSREAIEAFFCTL